MRLVELKPDFRSEPMESPEGKGIARARRETFMDENIEAMVDSFLDWDNPPKGRTAPKDYDVVVQDLIADAVLEHSEAIGFWVAWHLAGGFAHLEAAGWHRATIYRKIRRFRAAYGKHPDEYVFPYIKLDRRRYWTDQIKRELSGPGEPPDDAY